MEVRHPFGRLNYRDGLRFISAPLRLGYSVFRSDQTRITTRLPAVPHLICIGLWAIIAEQRQKRHVTPYRSTWALSWRPFNTPFLLLLTGRCS